MIFEIRWKMSKILKVDKVSRASSDSRRKVWMYTGNDISCQQQGNLETDNDLYILWPNCCCLCTSITFKKRSQML